MSLRSIRFLGFASILFLMAAGLGCQSEVAPDASSRSGQPEATTSVAEDLGLPVLRAKDYSSATIEAWQKSGVGEKELREHLNAEACTTSADQFSICIQAANSAVRSIDDKLFLAPVSYWSKGPYKLVQVERSFGRIQLAEVTRKKGKSDKSMKTLFDRLQRESADYDRELKKVFEASRPQSNEVFVELADMLLQKSRERFGEAWDAVLFQTYYSSLINQYDSHAQIIPKSLQEWMNSQKQNPGSRTNVESIYVDGLILVKRVHRDSDEFKAGLRQGDRIFKVNDFDIREADAQSISEALGRAESAADKTEILFEVFNEKDQSRVVRVKRSNSNESLDSESIVRRNDLPYRGKFYRVLRLETFSNTNACRMVSEQASQPPPSRGAEISGYVLDLRDNGGGFLSMAECVASLFLSGDLTIAYLRTFGVEKLEPTQAWKVSISDLASKPLVVLVNGNSASGSEYVAMALRDHLRATIVGLLTFGKGSMSLSEEWGPQKQFWLYKTGGVFYGPAGLTNNRVGLIPDFVVPWRTGAKPDEDFYSRSSLLSANATKSENEAVPPRDVDQNRYLMSCIDKKEIAEREQFAFGSAQGSDLQMLWATEILHCLSQKASRN